MESTVDALGYILLGAVLVYAIAGFYIFAICMARSEGK